MAKENGMETHTTVLEAVERALDPLRPAIEADGGEILVHAEASRISITLRFSPDTCGDCILPSDMLEAMVDDALEGVIQEAESITVTVEAP